MQSNGRRILAIQFCCTIFLLTGLGALMTACTSVPQNKYEWLSLFFDGVPDPNAPELQNPNAQATPDSVDVQVATQPLSTWTIHEPYAKRECQSCHTTTFSQNLTVAREELCFTCHFEGGMRQTLTHAPVLSGDCTVCHNPHKSESDHLLAVDEPALCLQCHDGVHVELPLAHELPEFNKYSCTDCHDPHGNNQKGYLRPKQPAGML
jgi:predicted CXXCH cytochrome family protein